MDFREVTDRQREVKQAVALRRKPGPIVHILPFPLWTFIFPQALKPYGAALSSLRYHSDARPLFKGLSHI